MVVLAYLRHKMKKKIHPSELISLIDEHQDAVINKAKNSTIDRKKKNHARLLASDFSDAAKEIINEHGVIETKEQHEALCKAIKKIRSETKTKFHFNLSAFNAINGAITIIKAAVKENYCLPTQEELDNNQAPISNNEFENIGWREDHEKISNIQQVLYYQIFDVPEPKLQELFQTLPLEDSDIEKTETIQTIQSQTNEFIVTILGRNIKKIITFSDLIDLIKKECPKLKGYLNLSQKTWSIFHDEYLIGVLKSLSEKDTDILTLQNWHSESQAKLQHWSKGYLFETLFPKKVSIFLDNQPSLKAFPLEEEELEWLNSQWPEVFNKHLSKAQFTTISEQLNTAFYGEGNNFRGSDELKSYFDQQIQEKSALRKRTQATIDTFQSNPEAVDQYEAQQTVIESLRTTLEGLYPTDLTKSISAIRTEIDETITSIPLLENKWNTWKREILQITTAVRSSDISDSERSSAITRLEKVEAQQSKFQKEVEFLRERLGNLRNLIISIENDIKSFEKKLTPYRSILKGKNPTLIFGKSIRLSIPLEDRKSVIQQKNNLSLALSDGEELQKLIEEFDPISTSEIVSLRQGSTAAPVKNTSVTISPDEEILMPHGTESNASAILEPKDDTSKLREKFKNRSNHPSNAGEESTKDDILRSKFRSRSHENTPKKKKEPRPESPNVFANIEPLSGLTGIQKLKSEALDKGGFTKPKEKNADSPYIAKSATEGINLEAFNPLEKDKTEILEIVLLLSPEGKRGAVWGLGIKKLAQIAIELDPQSYLAQLSENQSTHEFKAYLDTLEDEMKSIGIFFSGHPHPTKKNSFKPPLKGERLNSDGPFGYWKVNNRASKVLFIPTRATQIIVNHQTHRLKLNDDSYKDAQVIKTRLKEEGKAQFNKNNG